MGRDKKNSGEKKIRLCITLNRQLHKSIQKVMRESGESMSGVIEASVKFHLRDRLSYALERLNQATKDREHLDTQVNEWVVEVRRLKELRGEQP